MRNLLLWMSLAACLGTTTETYAQRSDQEKSFEDREFVSEYLTPIRIVCTDGLIRNADCLMEPFSGQVAITDRNVAVFRSTPDKKASILLDFGEEIHGRIQIFQSMSPENKPVRFRLCLGESVTEALSDVGCEGTTATNDHAVRDLDILVPWLGMAESGNSGFRFARLDLLDCDKDVNIAAIRAVSRYRDIPWLGSFRCNDERLNEIWRHASRNPGRQHRLRGPSAGPEEPGFHPGQDAAGPVDARLRVLFDVVDPDAAPPVYLVRRPGLPGCPA